MSSYLVSELDEVARSVAAGDHAAFDAIVAATSRRLYRMAARILGDPAEANDVLQDSYIRAYQALVAGQFDHRSTVETWLHRIVVRAAVDALRARRRRRMHEQPLTEPACDPNPALEARLALRELGAWLDELPAPERVALVLKQLEQMTVPEIARLLGTTEGAIEQRLVRARAALRRRR